MALSVAVVGALMSVNVPQQVEAEQLPERIATVLYQPEKYAYKPKPPVEVPQKAEPQPKQPAPVKTPEPVATTKLEITPNPKVDPSKKAAILETRKQPTAKAGGGKRGGPGQAEAKEGRGAKAKGKEGTRGQKLAKNTGTPQDRATRPSAMGGEGRGGGNSQVPDNANVDMLKGAGAKFLNILSSGNQQLGAGGEKIKGFGGFTTQGKGGLALSGEGRGGGGNADSLGGLADKGTGGGKVGTGKGALGSGAGIIGGKARVAIRSGGPEEAVVMGAIDADAVEAALLRRRDLFRLCYEKEINAEDAKLSGRIAASFVIGATGRVTQAGVESTSLNNANVERCVLKVIKDIDDFPIPRGGGVVQVTYPFKFSPQGR
jgi:TonB family protein